MPVMRDDSDLIGDTDTVFHPQNDPFATIIDLSA
jgi:hypothetical protein